MMTYLHDYEKSIESLERYSLILNVFCRYNTGLLFSAPVKGLIFFYWVEVITAQE